MTAIKNYNNNVILASEGGQEVIVLGKGVGFGLKPGSGVDAARVEKVFVPQDTAQIQRFKDILSNLPYEHLILASKIVDLGKERLRTPLNQSVIIALADHISFLIKRLAEGIDLQAPLAWDIRHIYPAEYAVGLEALDVMRQETGTTFPRAEAAAVALHLINAETDSPFMPDTMKTAAVIQECVAIAEEHYGISFDEGAGGFIGLVSMLRNTIMGFLRPSQNDSPNQPPAGDEKLYELLEAHYASELAGALKIAEMLEKKHGWILPKNDLCFFALFLSRLGGGSRQRLENIL
jgi:beta-glucoside operon transcriptional antiterminator